ncbi:MAG: TIM44-like domain-containing protein [Lachnospiraceae bacterium]|nr:TIM44-like domain-containing protein [Lachnospiraceae bacterium]
MKKHIKRWALLLLVILTVSVITAPIHTRADFGNFAGDSDYGGGGGGSSGGGGGGFISDLESEAISWVIAIIGLIVMLIYYALIRPIIDKIRGKKPEEEDDTVKELRAMREAGEKLRPVKEYGELDPGFKESAFCERLSNLYVQLQDAWHERNLESLRPYLTDGFYNQSERQLSEKRRNGVTPCVERIAVLDVRLRGFYQESGLDHMVARLKTRIVDYEISDSTGEVVSGSRKNEKFMEYEWELCRKSGVTTEDTPDKRTVSCPQCGAPLNINQTAECPYCGSVVTVVNEDWALDAIRGISQRTK